MALFSVNPRCMLMSLLRINLYTDNQERDQATCHNNGVPLRLFDPEMNALRFSETSVIKYQSARRNNPEDLDLQNGSGNLNSCKVVNILNGKIRCWVCKNYYSYLLFLLQFGQQNLNLSKIQKFPLLHHLIITSYLLI